MIYISYYGVYILMLIILIIYDTKNGRKIQHLLSSDKLYGCWLLMSISIFNYRIPIIQHILRLIATGYTLMISLMVLSKHNKKTYVPTIFFISFWIVAAFSIFYTVDLIETTFKVVEILADFLLVLALFKCENKNKMLCDIFKITIGMYVFMLTAALFGFVFLNNVGIFGRSNSGLLKVQLMGGIVGANSIGNMAVILWIWLINQPKAKYKLLLYSLSLFIIIFAQSRTSLILMVVMLVFNIFSIKHKMLYIMTLIIIVVVMYKFSDLVMAYFIRGAAMSNISSMSGRTGMWRVAREYIKQKPLLGYGYGVGGYIVSQKFEDMSSLHNGVYETLMGIGFIGLIPEVCIYIYVLFKLFINVIIYGIEKYCFEIMMVIYLTVRTYTSIGIGGWHSHEMMIWFLIVIMMASNSSHRTYREIAHYSFN